MDRDREPHASAGIVFLDPAQVRALVEVLAGPGAETQREGRAGERPASGADELVVAPCLVTVLRAAELLGVGRTTVYELIAAGELEVVHIGRSARVPVDSIDAYVLRLRERAPSRRRRLRPSTN